MYAVMRFGKSFTSMCCAVEMNANFVMVVSAKADVKNEWKKTVESHIKFEGYSFLDSSSLLKSETIISDKIASNEKIVLFFREGLKNNELKLLFEFALTRMFCLILFVKTNGTIRFIRCKFTIDLS